MEKLESSESKVQGAHILVMPYLIQGHVNPMVQFCKRLAYKGVTVTLVIPSLTKRFSIDSPSSSNIHVEHISDGIEEDEKLSVDAQVERVQTTVAKTLPHLIHRLFKSDCPPKVLVYDSAMTWALDIALEHGLHGAPFFTQSCAVNAVYYLIHQGLEIPLRGRIDSAPLQLLENCDLPSMVTRDMDLYPVLFKLVVGQFSNFQKAKWLLVNSFFHIEEEVTI